MLKSTVKTILFHTIEAISSPLRTMDQYHVWSHSHWFNDITFLFILVSELIYGFDSTSAATTIVKELLLLFGCRLLINHQTSNKKQCINVYFIPRFPPFTLEIHLISCFLKSFQKRVDDAGSSFHV